MRSQNYSAIATWSDEDECYIATSPEFEGLSGLGETAAESIQELYDAIAMTSDYLLEQGKSLPEPRTLSSASGQYRQRLPKSLHAKLVQLAELEGVSMNTLTVSILSQAVAGVAVCELVRDRLDREIAVSNMWSEGQWSSVFYGSATSQVNVSYPTVRRVSEAPPPGFVNRVMNLV